MRYGGSFAPPLPDAKLATYRQVIAQHAPQEIKQELLMLCTMIEKFRETPASSQPKDRHPAGKGFIQRLDEAEIQRIWEVVPWDWEVEALRGRLDRLPADSPLRTPAFHLLWFAIELTNDREPCTNDTL